MIPKGNEPPLTREVRTPVVPVQVTLGHQLCGGSFVCTLERHYDDGSSYWHKCDACGEIITLREKYPRIEYEPVEGAGPPSTR